MKPKPQKEKDLEELLEHEAVAELEEELLSEVQSSRSTEDLSYKLDLPLDVRGLVTLAKGLEKQRYLSNGPSILLGVGGVLTGPLLATRIAEYFVDNYDLNPALAYPISFLVGFILGLGAGWVLGDILEDYRQKKNDQNNENVLKPIREKLSCYQTKPSDDDIVLTTQKPKASGDLVALPGDYWLGRVNYIDEKQTLLQYFKDPAWGSQIVKRSDFEPKKVIAVLKPREYLSIEDLQALASTGAAVIFKYENEAHVNWPYVVGFLGEVKEGSLFDFLFELSADCGNILNTGHLVTADNKDDLRNGKITAQLLVPELKLTPSIPNYRVNAK